MGRAKRTASGLVVPSHVETGPAPKPTHWAVWTDGKGGEMFNGTQAQAIGVLVGFLHRHGMNKGFECGFGKRTEEPSKEEQALAPKPESVN